MKKLLSIIMAAVLVFSVVPAVVFESSAAAGSLPLDLDVSVTTTAGEWVVNTFTPTEDGIYIFSSSGSYDTLGYIALNEGEADAYIRYFAKGVKAYGREIWLRPLHEANGDWYDFAANTVGATLGAAFSMLLVRFSPKA